MVISGIGLLTPLGADYHTTSEAWKMGAKAKLITPKNFAKTSLKREKVAAPPNFKASERLGGRRMIKYMSDAAVLGCVAAKEAARDAHMKHRFKPERIGLFAGTGLASTDIQDVVPMLNNSVDDEGSFSCRLFGERGLLHTNPLLSFKILANMPPCLISVQENIKGPNLIFCPWEGQTASALTEAWWALKSGNIDCAMVGAADYPISPITMIYLRRKGLLKKDEFAAAAAAYLVMERADSAQKSEIKPYARIKRLEVTPTTKPIYDPLAKRIGRAYAAAPALLLALMCQGADKNSHINGVDNLNFEIELETIS